MFLGSQDRSSLDCREQPRIVFLTESWESRCAVYADQLRLSDSFRSEVSTKIHWESVYFPFAGDDSKQRLLHRMSLNNLAFAR